MVFACDMCITQPHRQDKKVCNTKVSSCKAVTWRRCAAHHTSMAANAAQDTSRMEERWGWRPVQSARTQQEGQSEAQRTHQLDNFFREIIKTQRRWWTGLCLPEQGSPSGSYAHKASVWWREPSAAARSATSRLLELQHDHLHSEGLFPEVLQVRIPNEAHGGVLGSIPEGTLLGQITTIYPHTHTQGWLKVSNQPDARC